MSLYKVSVNAQITIFEEHSFSIEASCPEEAKELAHEAYKREVDGKYGWTDYDESHIEYCRKVSD